MVGLEFVDQAEQIRHRLLDARVLAEFCCGGDGSAVEHAHVNPVGFDNSETGGGITRIYSKNNQFAFGFRQSQGIIAISIFASMQSAGFAPARWRLPLPGRLFSG